jgi:DNA-binding transcriptional ArsR family regulator
MPADSSIEPAIALFAALANPLRLKVLIALGRLGPMSAGEIQAIVGAEQSAVSHQLAALRRSRLVSSERNGRQRIYQLVDHHVSHIVEDALEHANEVDS